jgi:hypothetical protein
VEVNAFDPEKEVKVKSRMDRFLKPGETTETITPEELKKR